MVLFPHAKINIGLNILNRRDDGFHNIETVFYPIGLSDVLEFIEAPNGKLEFSCSGIMIDNPEHNLCMKAYSLIQDKYDIPPLHVHLNKIIPVGAGLGGGSSDAAFMMKGLNEYFDLGMDVETMSQLLVGIGSDCPFFLHEKPLFAEGKGERFSAVGIDISGKYLLLVNPNIHVPTAAAYKGVSPKTPRIGVKEIVKRPVDKWKEILVNDFEDSVTGQFPVIKELKSKMYAAGAAYAAMSGSGSSVFGIFNHKMDRHIFDQEHFIWDGLLS